MGRLLSRAVTLPSRGAGSSWGPGQTRASAEPATSGEASTTMSSNVSTTPIM